MSKDNDRETPLLTLSVITGVTKIAGPVWVKYIQLLYDSGVALSTSVAKTYWEYYQKGKIKSFKKDEFDKVQKDEEEAKIEKETRKKVQQELKKAHLAADLSTQTSQKQPKKQKSETEKKVVYSYKFLFFHRFSVRDGRPSRTVFDQFYVILNNTNKEI